MNEAEGDDGRLVPLTAAAWWSSTDSRGNDSDARELVNDDRRLPKLNNLRTPCLRGEVDLLTSEAGPGECGGRN